METDKKTRLYSPELLDCNLVQSFKKLDWTIRSSLKLDCSYIYFYFKTIERIIIIILYYATSISFIVLNNSHISLNVLIY
jgi:hypothetical protein